jgi:putative citrate transport
LHVTGWINAVWLLGVVAAVLALAAPLREAAIVLLGALSFLTTPVGVREANRFTAVPMLEVAAVFLGIFLTMIPALELLRARGAALGVSEPWQFFWATGHSRRSWTTPPPT